MFSSKRILRKRWARKAIAFAGAEYLRLVFLTNRHAVAAEPLYARAEPDLELRSHAAGDPTGLDAGVELACIDLRQPRRIGPGRGEHSARLRHKQQRRRAHRLGDSERHRVRVDVVHRARGVGAHRRDDRHEAGLQEYHDHRRVHAGDVSHVPEVHALAVDLPWRPANHGDEAAVDAREPHGRHAACARPRDEAGVQLAAHRP